MIELHACQIGTISARAFANVENLGELKILRNTVGDLDTSESILSKALKTRMEENTLECNCGMKWMTSVEVGFFRTLPGQVLISGDVGCELLQHECFLPIHQIIHQSQMSQRGV